MGQRRGRPRKAENEKRLVRKGLSWTTIEWERIVRACDALEVDPIDFVRTTTLRRVNALWLEMGWHDHGTYQQGGLVHDRTIARDGSLDDGEQK